MEICVRGGCVADEEAQGLADPDGAAERERAGRLVGAEETAHEEVARVVFGPVLVDHEPGEESARDERLLFGGEGGDLPTQALERRLSGERVDVLPSQRVITDSRPIGRQPCETTVRTGSPETTAPTAPSAYTASSR